MSRSYLRPCRIIRLICIIISVVVPAPLVDIAVAVVKSPPVRFEASNINCGLPVFTGSRFKRRIIKIVFLYLVRIMPVKVGFCRIQGLFRIEWRSCSGAAGILPLCLSRKPVSVCAGVPAYAVISDRIHRRQPGVFTLRVCEPYRFKPGNVLDRELISFKISRVTSHQPRVFFLCSLVGIHIE